MNKKTMWGVVFVATLTNMLQLGSRLVVSALVPDIIAALDISTTVMGIILSGLWAAVAVMQLPSGVISDLFGAKRAVQSAVVIAGAALAGISVTTSPVLIGVLIVVLGSGCGLYYAAGTVLLDRVTDDSSNNVLFSLHISGGAIAGAALPTLAVKIAEQTSWQTPLAVLAAFAGVLFILHTLFIPSKEQTSERTTFDDIVAGLRQLPHKEELVYPFSVATVGWIVFSGLSSFFPTFLIQHRGVNPTTAVYLFSAIFLVSSVTLPLAGRLADKYTEELILTTVFFITSIGLLTLVYVPFQAALYVGVFLVGAGICWAGVISAMLVEVFDSKQTGTGYGAARTLSKLVGAGGGALLGAMTDLANWSVSITVLVVVLGVGIGILAANRS